MNKKDIMLNLIVENANTFMNQEQFDIFPYTELSQEIFNRTKKYFANDACYEDVVCLISTSIMEKGKCGVLFTIDKIYVKAWGGIFTNSYSYFFSQYNSAEFGDFSEFKDDEIREIMYRLSNIKEENNTTKVWKVGLCLIAGLLGLEVGSEITDFQVNKNNCDINDNIKDL